jgi:mannose/fructose/N-acetylgalactosamine-specific phosphotransferase system component IID
MYVVLMMALAEALSSQGTVLGAIVTFVLYGCAPLALVLYLLGTPSRRRARRAAEAAEATNAAAQTAAVPVSASTTPPPPSVR